MTKKIELGSLRDNHGHAMTIMRVDGVLRNKDAIDKFLADHGSHGIYVD